MKCQKDKNGQRASAQRRLPEHYCANIWIELAQLEKYSTYWTEREGLQAYTSDSVDKLVKSVTEELKELGNIDLEVQRNDFLQEVQKLKTKLAVEV